MRGRRSGSRSSRHIPIAEANARRNAADRRVTFLGGDASELAPLAGPADLICSNILRSVNALLMPAILAALAPTGIAIFAGMEEAEAPLFRPVLETGRLTVIDEVRDTGWWSVAVRRMSCRQCSSCRRPSVDGAVLPLDDAERHHLTVRRVGAAAELLVFDGAGHTARGTLVGRGEAVSVGVVQWCPPPARTLLAVGAGDKERFLALAERCTELGVTHLVPMVTERSEAVDSRLRSAALDKARKRAREACKQSANPWAAIVEDHCQLRDLPARYPGMRWMLAQPDAARCPSIEAVAAIGWLVGPEGGLTPDEIAWATDTLGVRAVGLGPTVLRFDTAAAAAAVITADRRTTTGE